MTTIKTIAIVGATGNMGSAIAKFLAKNRDYRFAPHVQLQLVGGIENSSSLNQIIMKDRIKSFFALVASLAISFWLLCRYSVGA
jgi:hypothetical protein